jgi:CRP-like cAMP-binding protein
MTDEENARAVEILKDIGFMRHLSMGDIEKLMVKFRKVTFEKGSHILRQGNAGGALFLISKGKVDVFVKDREGRELKVAVLGPGDFCGEMALITGEARTASIIATEETEIFLLGKKAFTHIFMENKAIGAKIEKVIDERLEGTNHAFQAADGPEPIQKGWLLRKLTKG